MRCSIDWSARCWLSIRPLDHGVDSQCGEAYKDRTGGTLLFRLERKVNMGATRSNKLPPSDWVTRCVQQIQLVDPGIDGEEAASVAQQLLSFERTGAMPPEKAVKFVVSELAGRTPRFERRSPSRLLTSFRLE